MTWRMTLGTCSLDDAALEVRRAAWAALDGHRLDARPLPEGFAVTYRDDHGVAEELGRLAAAEGGCCGFATWEVVPHGDALVLTVTGPDPGISELRRAFLDGR